MGAGGSFKQNRFVLLASRHSLDLFLNLVLLCESTAKIFCLGSTFGNFGKCRFLLAGLKKLEIISAPILSYVCQNGVNMTTRELILSSCHPVKYFPLSVP